MNLLRHIVIPAAIFASTTGAVWLARPAGSAADVPKSQAEASAKASSRERKLRNKEVPPEVLARLAPIRNAKNTEDRLRATIQLAQSLPVSEIEAWHEAEWFDGEEDMQSYLFYRVSRARWLEADPASLMEHCLRKDRKYTTEMAAEWAKRDPAAALAFLDGVKPAGQRGKLLSGMGAALAKADPKLALSKINEFQGLLGSQQQYQLNTIIAELGKSSPELLKAELDNLPLALRAGAIQTLTKAALQKDFSGTLAELSQAKGGRRTFANAVQHDDKLMQQIARNPEMLPPGWFGEVAGNASYYLVKEDPARWLDADLESMGLNQNQARNLRSQAISQLGSQDPERVKALLDSADLNDELRQTAISSVAAKLSKDKPKFEAWLATLSNPGEIEMAKNAALNQSGHSGLGVTPTSLLASLVEPSTNLDWNQTRSMGTWGADKTATFSKEFDTLPSDQKPVVAKKLVQGHYNSGVPIAIQAQLLDYLLVNPEPENTDESSVHQQQGRNPLVQASSQLAARWADEDPAAAGKWVSSLPSGEERLWAAKNLAARWAEYEPAATKRWIATLPGEEQHEVQTYLDSGRHR